MGRSTCGKLDCSPRTPLEEEVLVSFLKEASLLGGLHFIVSSLVCNFLLYKGSDCS